MGVTRLASWLAFWLAFCANAFFEVVASGAVKVEIGQTYPLREARRAHEALEARETIGSSVLVPD